MPAWTGSLRLIEVADALHALGIAWFCPSAGGHLAANKKIACSQFPLKTGA
jgi:hypothetical protein